MSKQPTLSDATLTVTNRYATLRFERDDVRNALTGTALIDDLCATTAWANADLRIGCENTRFGETFVNLGIIPGDGGAWFLQRLVGYQRAAELTFSGRIIDSEEALTLGLLLECVPKETLIATAERYASEYASKPPQALRATKRLMKLAQRQELGDFLDVCADVQSQCHHTEDHQRALNAFLTKTDARFEGN